MQDPGRGERGWGAHQAAARARQPPAAAEATAAAAPSLRRRRALTAPLSIVSLFRATYSPGTQCAGPCPGRNRPPQPIWARRGPPRPPRPAPAAAVVAMVKGKGKNHGKGDRPASGAKPMTPRHSNDPNRPSKSVGGKRDAATVSARTC